MAYAYCRRKFYKDDASEAEQYVYCAQPIKKANSLDWCDDCQKRLPFWPSADDGCPDCSSPTRHDWPCPVTNQD